MTRALRVSAALLLTLVNVAGRAGAQTSADKAAAEELFRQGRMLTKDRRFTEACAKFADSQRLDPAVGTELNLARCYEDNGQTASAWALYNDVAVVAHRAGQLDRARLALRRAADLEKRLSRLTIEVASNDGAEGFAVQRDGKVVGQSEWNTPIPIDPGDHTVVATASGRRAWSTRVTVAHGIRSRPCSRRHLDDDSIGWLSGWHYYDTGHEPRVSTGARTPSSGANHRPGHRRSGRRGALDRRHSRLGCREYLQQCSLSQE
jgi:hypothetical protein